MRPGNIAVSAALADHATMQSGTYHKGKEMTKFVTRPVVIEAVQWDGLADTANSFIGERYGTDWEYVSRSSDLVISTEEGKMIVKEGDWIIEGVAGGFFTCNPNIFEQTYELAKS